MPRKPISDECTVAQRARAAVAQARANGPHARANRAFRDRLELEGRLSAIKLSKKRSARTLYRRSQVCRLAEGRTR